MTSPWSDDSVFNDVTTLEARRFLLEACGLEGLKGCPKDDPNYANAWQENTYFDNDIGDEWSKSGQFPVLEGGATVDKGVLDINKCEEKPGYFGCELKSGWDDMIFKCPSGWHWMPYHGGWSGKHGKCVKNRQYGGQSDQHSPLVLRDGPRGKQWWQTKYVDVGHIEGVINCPEGFHLNETYKGWDGKVVGGKCAQTINWTAAFQVLQPPNSQTNPLFSLIFRGDPTKPLPIEPIPHPYNLLPCHKTDSRGVEVNCDGTDPANDITGCGVPGSVEELSGQCSSSNDQDPTDSTDWGWNLTEFSLSSEYLIGVALCGIPVGYYAKTQNNMGVLVIYSAATLGLPYAYDKIVEYLSAKKSKGDMLVAVAVAGTAVTLGLAIGLAHMGVPSNLAGYVGLAGLLVTGIGVAYVAVEEGYVENIIEWVVKAFAGGLKDAGKGIWGAIGDIF